MGTLSSRCEIIDKTKVGFTWLCKCFLSVCVLVTNVVTVTAVAATSGDNTQVRTRGKWPQLSALPSPIYWHNFTHRTQHRTPLCGERQKADNQPDCWRSVVFIGALLFCWSPDPISTLPTKPAAPLTPDCLHTAPLNPTVSCYIWSLVQVWDQGQGTGDSQ